MKKLWLLLVIGILTMNSVACGKITAMRTTRGETVEEATEEETTEEETTEEETTEEETTEASKSVVPFIGEEGDADYDGFEYLYRDRISTNTSENPATGKMEFQDVTVYIPYSSYVYTTERDNIQSESLGVTFDVILNPWILDYIDYKTQTLEESMESYIEDEYTDIYSSSDWVDVKIGEISLSKDGKLASCKVTYYNPNYSDGLSYIENFLDMRQLDNDLILVTVVSIDTDETERKTPELLQELEEFYGIDIAWDAEEAKKKAGVTREDIEDNQEDEEFNPDSESLHLSDENLTFDLPEGWKAVEGMEDTYAPDGEITFSTGYIMIQEEYVGENVASSMELMDDEFVREMFIAMLGSGEDQDFGLTSVDCNWGKAYYLDNIMVEESLKLLMNAYLVYADNGYIYTIASVSMGSEESKTMIAEGLEQIFSTARLVQGETI